MEAAAEIQYTFTQTKLRPIQRRIEEHRLRLDIWISDCKVQEGALSSITAENEPSLYNLVTDLFKRFTVLAKLIALEIDTIKGHAQASLNESSRQT